MLGLILNPLSFTASWNVGTLTSCSCSVSREPVSELAVCGAEPVRVPWSGPGGFWQIIIHISLTYQLQKIII